MTLKTSSQLNDLETAHLVQTLREHQIELELQNEELRIAKIKADKAIEKYSELYDFAPSGYFTLSKQGDIIELNISGSLMFGKERSYLTNKRFNLFVSDETKPIFNDFLRKIFQCKTRITCEVMLLVEGSSPIYVQLTGLLSEIEERCLLTAVNITARKKIEDDLKLNQDFLNNIIENSPNPLWISDDKGVLIRMNQACRNIFQVSDEDIIGKYNIFKDNIIAAQGFMPQVKDVFENGTTASFVTSYDASKINGLSSVPSRKLILEVHISPIFNSDGKLTNAIIQHFDITSRNVAERLVIAGKLRLDKTQEIAHLGSWELNLEDGQITWSDEVYRIFGLIPQEFEATYEAFLDLVHPEDRQSVNSAYMDSIHNRHAGYEIEHRIIRKNSGEIRYIFEKCEHIRDASGQIIRSVGMVQDITDKKRVEQALILSEEKFRSFIQFSSDPIFGFNRDETYRYVNEAFSRPFGKNPGEIIGKTLFDIFTHDEAEKRVTLLRKVFQTGEMGEIEVQVINHSGEFQYYLTTADPLKNEEGEVQYVNCVSKDITQLKKAEQALLEREEIFQSFMDHSPVYIFFKDENLRTINLSKNYETLLGKPLSEVIGKKMSEVLPLPIAINMEANDMETMKAGEIFTTEEEFKGRFFSTIKFPVMIHGKPQYLAGFTIDITDRNKTEEALKASEAQLTALVAAIPDMIFIQDRKGVYLDYRGPISDELYAKPENFIGKNMYDVIPHEIAQQFETAIQAAQQTGEVQLCKYSMQMPDGLHYFEAKIAAFSESKFLSVIRNVSSHKQAEELIKIKNKDLQRINAEKDKFFSIIAHDLRSPFSGFLGLTEALARRLPDMTLTEIQEITFLMRNSAVHLFRLLGNLLEWSRMERGLMAFIPKSFTVSQKIADNLFLADQLADQKEILIRKKIPKKLVVFADENMFGSIIRNLLSNAVKFTPKGGKITISAKQYADQMVRISVEDSGIGMSQQLIDHLFLLDDIQSNRKGTDGEYSYGLGLIICKDYIDKHGGKLEIKSNPGKGSTFSFFLPAGSL